MFDINAKQPISLQRSGQASHDNWEKSFRGDVSLAAFTDALLHLCGRQGPGGALHRAAAKDFHSVGLSGWTAIGPARMDTFFYGQETPERVPFTNRQGWATNSPRLKILVPIVRFLGQRGADGLPGQDDFRQWWLHNTLKLQVLALPRS